MVTSYTTGKFHPYPPEAIRYVAALANQNRRVLENLIHEMKRLGMIDKLVTTLLDHNETFDSLNDLFEDREEGPRRCYCLAKSMHERYAKFMSEAVGPPMADLEDEDEPIEPPEGDDEESLQDLEDEPQPDDEELDGLEPDDEEEEDDEEMDDSEEEEDEEMDGPPPRGKKFAHDNVLDAISKFSHMRKAMKAY